MAGWDDLVAQATDGGLIEWSVTGAVEGTDWLHQWPVTSPLADSVGVPFNFSQITAANVTAKVWQGVTEIASLDWVGRADGTFTLSAPASRTEGLAGEYMNYRTGRSFSWTVVATLPNGKKAQLIRGQYQVRQKETA